MNEHLYSSAQILFCRNHLFISRGQRSISVVSCFLLPSPFLMGLDTFESLMPLAHMYTSAINHNVANESKFKPTTAEGLISSLLLIIPFILC